jgi:hypothetical protein
MFVRMMVGEMEPEEKGNVVSIVVGAWLKFVEGLSDVNVDGIWLAKIDGNIEGDTVGYLEGTIDGDVVGRADGHFDGRADGEFDGYNVELGDCVTPFVPSC